MQKGIIVFFAILAMVAGMLVTSGTATRAQDPEPDLSSKIDEVLDNQKSILRGIESLKQELAIVKIRVTQQQ